MQLATLDAIGLYQTSTTGFNYPQNATVVPVLPDGTAAGNFAVLQSPAANGFRQASIAFRLDSSSDVDDIRTLYETKELVTYVGSESDSHHVRVLEFSPQWQGNELWDCTATLVEMPLEAGS